MGLFTGDDDHDCGEVVYEDRTFFFGRRVYRDLACGKKVDDAQAGRVVDPGDQPLSWYFGFGGKKR